MDDHMYDQMMSYAECELIPRFQQGSCQTVRAMKKCRTCVLPLMLLENGQDMTKLLRQLSWRCLNGSYELYGRRISSNDH